MLASSIEQKTLITQNCSSGLFMTHALAVCNTILVSLFTKQVAVCWRVALCYYYFDQNLRYWDKCAANNFWSKIMRYDYFIMLYNESIFILVRQFFLMYPGFKHLKQMFPFFKISLLVSMSFFIGRYNDLW